MLRVRMLALILGIMTTMSFIVGCGGGGGGGGGGANNSETVFAEVADIPDGQAGLVTVLFKLFSDEPTGDVSVLVHFSINNGLSWGLATQAGGDQLFGMHSDSSGEQYTYVWNSAQDTSGAQNVILRFTPNIGGVSTHTNEFTVNNVITFATLTNTLFFVGGQSVTLSFSLESNSTASFTLPGDFERFDAGSGLWVNMTDPSGGSLNGLTFTVGPQGTPAINSVDWDSFVDLVAVDGPDANVLVRVVLLITGSQNFDHDPLKVNNEVTVSVSNVPLYPDHVEGTRVPVQFSLVHPVATVTGVVDVDIEFSTTAGASWSDITLGTGSGAITGLDASTGGGTSYQVTWDTITDIPASLIAPVLNVMLRVVVVINGNTAVPGNDGFTVDNTTLPTPQNVVVTTDSWTNIQVDYDLFDADGPTTVDVMIDVLINGGGGGAQIYENTDDPNTDGITGLTADSPQNSLVFIWDSWADGYGISGSNFQVRVTVVDSGLSATAASFTMTNTPDTRLVSGSGNRGFNVQTVIGVDGTIHAVYSVGTTTAVPANGDAQIAYDNSGPDGVFGTGDDFPVEDLLHATNDIWAQSISMAIDPGDDFLYVIMVRDDQPTTTNSDGTLGAIRYEKGADASWASPNSADKKFDGTGNYKTTPGSYAQIKTSTAIDDDGMTFVTFFKLIDSSLRLLSAGADGEFEEFTDNQSSTVAVNGNPGADNGQNCEIYIDPTNSGTVFGVYNNNQRVVYRTATYDDGGFGDPDWGDILGVQAAVTLDDFDVVTSRKRPDIVVDSNNIKHITWTSAGNVIMYLNSVDATVSTTDDSYRVYVTSNAGSMYPIIKVDGYDHPMVGCIDALSGIYYLYYYPSGSTFDQDSVRVSFIAQNLNGLSNVGFDFERDDATFVAPPGYLPFGKGRAHVVWPNPGSFILRYHTSEDIP